MGKRQRVEVEAVADSAHASAPGALPFVCYFPTSTPSTDEANKLEFSAFTKATGRGGQQVLVGSRERIDYVGSTNGPEFSAAQPCSYAVGVYDKETGKLQVIPINGGRVCRMEARVRGLDYGPSAAPGSGASDEKTREERLTLNKRLVGVFGSGRRRRQMDAREEGIVRVEKLGDTGALTQILEAQVAQASRDGLTRADVLQRATAVRNVPPHHADASEPGAAYVLDEIIPAGAAAALDTGRLYKAAGNSDVADQLLSSGELSAYAAGRLHLLNDPDKGKGGQG
ncbi:hypothetical protein FOA52_013440 [Chlamydomonas sp. UWO 241]|nr:hypothetical protein FOA52_013440 [Chlamydomonas sp. UWO 241]